jgi:Flp pilus assembly protein TadD
VSTHLRYRFLLRYLSLLLTLAMVAGRLAAQSPAGAFPQWTSDASVSGRSSSNQTGSNQIGSNPTGVDNLTGWTDSLPGGRGPSWDSPQGPGAFSRVPRESRPTDSSGASLEEPQGFTATASPRESGPVSADQLRHPLTGKALRLIRKAERLIKAGDHLHAIEELRRDVANPAAAPYAHSLLGQEYIRTWQFGEAIPELEEGVRLLPSSVPDHANLGYAFLMTRRLDSAEHELLRALELQPKNPHTHLALGVLRYSQGSHDQEAQQHLEFAAHELPAAHLILAKFYRRVGRTEDSDREFNAYLKVTGATDSGPLRRWLQ